MSKKNEAIRAVLLSQIHDRFEATNVDRPDEQHTQQPSTSSPADD